MNTQLKTYGADLLAKAVEAVYAVGQTDYSIEPLV